MIKEGKLWCKANVKNTRKEKKIVGVLSAIMVLLIAAFSFVGCGNGISNEINTDLQYIVFHDNIGNSYKLSKCEKLTVEYDYDEHATYTFGYDAYYVQDDAQPFASEENIRTVDGNKPGKYSICVVTRIHGGGEEWTFLYVVVKEKPRITPEISFDPHGALEYVENKRYVYKYEEGKFPNYPVLQVTYHNNPLQLRHDGIYYAEELETGKIMLIDEVKVGEYRIYYCVQDFSYVNECDKGIYSDIFLSVIVKYVEV